MCGRQLARPSPERPPSACWKAILSGCTQDTCQMPASTQVHTTVCTVTQIRYIKASPPHHLPAHLQTVGRSQSSVRLSEDTMQEQPFSFIRIYVAQVSFHQTTVGADRRPRTDRAFRPRPYIYLLLALWFKDSSTHASFHRVRCPCPQLMVQSSI